MTENFRAYLPYRIAPPPAATPQRQRRLVPPTSNRAMSGWVIPAS
jgi:hypothetical protein